MLISAGMTGAFCAVFAFVISNIAPMLGVGAVLTTSFVSGFLGSIFARLVLKK
jgi:uncharacterized membrane protein YjjB (DUF3815 family)